MDSQVTLRGCLFGLVGFGLGVGSIVVFATHQGENFTVGWTVTGFVMLLTGVFCALQVMYAGSTDYGCGYCGTALYIADPKFSGDMTPRSWT